MSDRHKAARKTLRAPASEFSRQMAAAKKAGKTWNQWAIEALALVGLSLLLSACSAATDAPAPAEPPAPYSEAWYRLPKCAARPAEGVCQNGQWSELECDRPMATLDQDCANSIRGVASCGRLDGMAGPSHCEATGDPSLWCCQ